MFGLAKTQIVNNMLVAIDRIDVCILVNVFWLQTLFQECTESPIHDT